MTERNPLKWRPARGLIAAVAAAALLFSSASAQGLLNLLPEDTFFALGVHELARHDAKFAPFAEEWERLGLPELLASAVSSNDLAELDELTDALDSVPEEFAELSAYDFMGEEAWLAASAGGFIPSVIVVARVSADASTAVNTALERGVADGGFIRLEEGSAGFYMTVNQDEEGDDLPLAVAIDGNLLAVASDADALRGVLRRHQGASESNFTDSTGYDAAVRPLLPGNFITYFDLPTVVDIVEPFAAGLGFDASIDRLGRALRTAGTFGNVSRITTNGLEGYSRQVLGDASLDPALHALLSRNVPASNDTMSFVDASAISFQANGADIAGWWSYLDNFVADLEELEIGPLSDFLRDNLGVDLGALLFDWMGTTSAAIAHYTPAVEVGIMPENLLGESVYLIEATDENAAREGLSTLVQLGAMFASSFADPFGENSDDMMLGAPTTRQVAGVSVDSYDLVDGLTLEITVSDGYALIATSPASMDAALLAASSGGQASALISSLANEVPPGAGSFMLSDTGATLLMTGEQLASQYGLFLGLAGGDIDFDTAEQASAALGDYFAFLSSKVGGQYSYSAVDGNVIIGTSNSEVRW